MRISAFLLAALLPATTSYAEDWAGAHVGLSVSASNGAQDIGIISFPAEGTTTSLFGGYDWQTGNLVFGGELALHSNDIGLTGFPAISYNRLTDLKGRIGYAAGRALIYGVIGYSWAEYQNGPAFFDDLDGTAYGIGAEFLVSEKVFSGVEYLHRDLNHANAGVITDISTVTLRVGMKF